MYDIFEIKNSNEFLLFISCKPIESRLPRYVQSIPDGLPCFCNFCCWFVPKSLACLLSAMTDTLPRYLAQDISLNGDSHFHLLLHSCLMQDEVIHDLSARITYDRTDLVTTAKAFLETPQLSTIIHCTCKLGIPNGDLEVRFLAGDNIHVHWNGVRRIFVRVRMIESTTLAVLTAMLQDDIDSGHSISDIENPEQNQSFRPWSDQDDSETDTLDEDD